jgi:hypothetical protein
MDQPSKRGLPPVQMSGKPTNTMETSEFTARELAAVSAILRIGFGDRLGRLGAYSSAFGKLGITCFAENETLLGIPGLKEAGDCARRTCDYEHRPDLEENVDDAP